jgi:hypothetical protein
MKAISMGLLVPAMNASRPSFGIHDDCRTLARSNDYACDAKRNFQQFEHSVGCEERYAGDTQNPNQQKSDAQYEQCGSFDIMHVSPPSFLDERFCRTCGLGGQSLDYAPPIAILVSKTKPS